MMPTAVYLDSVSPATRRTVSMAMRLHGARVYVSGDRVATERHDVYDAEDYWVVEPDGHAWHYHTTARSTTMYRREVTQ